MKFNIEERYKYAIGVYKIINLINGKFYIGSTSREFYGRYKQHVNTFKNNKNYCKKLNNAFKKYGIENFEFTLLEITTKENVISTEQKYLDLGFDYNICLKANSKLGCKHSEETKNKLRSGNHINIHKKKVVQYTLNGEKIRTFDSISEAALFLNINSYTSICGCCHNKRFSAYGYRWCYKNKKLKKVKKPKNNRQKIYIKNNSIYLEFNSQIECAKYLNVYQSYISYHLKKGFSKKHNLEIGRINK